METVILVIHVFTALAIVGLVLLQHGKGADVGAAFGGGASGSIFGATGSANFLSRATAILAAVFFLTSLGLTYFSTRKTEHKGVMSQPALPANPAPAVPAPGSAIPVPQQQQPQQPQPQQPQSQQPQQQQPAAGPGAPETGSKAQEVPK